jgi:hypothetical protein
MDLKLSVHHRGSTSAEDNMRLTITAMMCGFLLITSNAFSDTGNGTDPSTQAHDNVVTCFESERTAEVLAAVKPFVSRDDPDLEAGWPVYAYHGSGTYHGGQAIHTLVMNLDTDPELEIITTALATGPIYAWNHDGTLVDGWPVSGAGAGYLAGGLVATGGAPGVVVGFWDGQIAVFDAVGAMQPGWPITAANYIATPPSLADVTGLDQDEIFIEEEDWSLHGYTAGGSILSGWPVSGDGGQERHTAALGDIDGDGEIEIITCSSATTPGVYMFAYNPDGSLVPGWPVNIEPEGYGAADAFPVIGQTDTDPEPEIIVANKRGEVRIHGGDGTLEAVLDYTGTFFYSTAPALADLDGDGLVEIVVQTNDYLNVIRSDGSSYPGWPVALGGNWWLGNSSPVIGDVDGDGDQDIVITVNSAGSGTDGELRAYDTSGAMLPQFPKALPIGSGAVPAIADIDLDGRNEIIVAGSYWDGYSGEYPKCWVYDLQGSSYGSVIWGQFMHDPAHTGYLDDSEPTAVESADPIWPTGGGTITVSPNPGSGSMLISVRGEGNTWEPVSIYDISGRLVRQLRHGNDMVWDSRNSGGLPVPAGVYLLRSGASFGRAMVVR